MINTQRSPTQITCEQPPITRLTIRSRGSSTPQGGGGLHVEQQLCAGPERLPRRAVAQPLPPAPRPGEVQQRRAVRHRAHHGALSRCRARLLPPHDGRLPDPGVGGATGEGHGDVAGGRDRLVRRQAEEGDVEGCAAGLGERLAVRAVACSGMP